jgi:hypothetical protein
LLANTYIAAGERQPVSEADMTPLCRGRAAHADVGRISLKSPPRSTSSLRANPTALTKVRFVRNNMAIASGIGTCGKNSQGVPVGAGQLTLLIDGLTVSGAVRQ